MQGPIVRAASILGLLGVALGAFGAHLLKKQPGFNHEVWETAVQYHLIHSVVLLALGLSSGAASLRFRDAAAWCFAVGIGVFSGSLYVLAVTGVKVLGAVTPIGGVLFLTGWGLLAAGQRRSQKNA